MRVIRIKRDTPDGLDPVFEAYQQLRRLYEAATSATQFCKCKGECPCDTHILLPGTNEAVDTNDSNELNSLQRWLEQEFAKRINGGRV